MTPGWISAPSSADAMAGAKAAAMTAQAVASKVRWFMKSSTPWLSPRSAGRGRFDFACPLALVSKRSNTFPASIGNDQHLLLAPPFGGASRHPIRRIERHMGLLDGKNAIITGSARGIGRATAELFVAEGARVLINDIDGDVAEQAASEIDGETAVFSGDLTEPGVPDELVKKAVDEFGEVDILINNAGYTWDGVAHKMTDEQFQAMLDIHTVAPFRLARAIAPHWREAAKAEKAEGVERFRKLVNISSISGTMGNAG